MTNNNRAAFDAAFVSDDTPPVSRAGWLLVGVIGIAVACALVVLAGMV